LLNEIAGQVGAAKDEMEPYLTDEHLKQVQLARQFQRNLNSRIKPDGMLDLTGVALGPNTQVMRPFTPVSLHAYV